jgi:hypothetical protein
MPNPATANMALIMPTEGGDAGEWDAYINDAADLIDAHDHSTGKGVKVKTNGLDINADLTFASGGSYSAITNVKAVDFQPHAASAMTAYAGAFFVNSSDSNNLYFRTPTGVNVRIINGAAVDTTTSGGIGGDYAAIPAEVAYVDASDTYTFRQTAAGNWARLQCGPVRIAELGTTESVYIELAAPAALGASYTITPATALPGSTQLVQIGSTGSLTYTNTVSGLITASAGVTAASGQHFTVSGAGEYKHGSKWMHLPALGLPEDSAALDNINVNAGYVTCAASATTEWRVPIPLQRGERILGSEVRLNRGGAGSIVTTLRRWDGAGSQTNLATVTTAAGTGFTTVTVGSGLTETCEAGESFYMYIAIDNTANQVATVSINYDRP